jgi:hypothetical protein
MMSAVPETDRPPSERDATGIPWLLVLGLASVTTSLVVRVVHRGPYIMGWDVIAAAEGLHLASTRSLPGAVAYLFAQSRHHWNPFPQCSVPFALIPGYLARVWPWEFWPHVLVLAVWLASLGVVLRVARLRLRDAGVVLLAWGASPSLLSLSVMGMPWASAFLPHVLALWITTSASVRRRLLLTIAACVVVAELSWHVYELGKTVGGVFLAAAFLCRGVPLVARVVWLATGGYQLYEAFFVHRSANLTVFAFQAGTTWEAVRPSVMAALAAVRAVGEAFLTQELDLPVLLALALASLVLVRRERWLLRVTFLAQVGLVVLLAFYDASLLRPRRAMLVGSYGILLVAWLWHEAGPRLRRIVAAVLIAGNVWQGVDLYRFVETPFPNPGAGFSLPHIRSIDGIGMVGFADVDWLLDLRRRVDAGERLLLLENYSCYTENLTNPVAVPERLYVSLGDERFRRSVFIFGKQDCRYDCLPIHPLEDLPAFLDGVRPDGPVPPDTLGIHYAQSCEGPGSDAAELKAQLAAVAERFTLEAHATRDGLFMRYRIVGPR